MKQFVLFCLLSVPMTISAQTQYFLPTGNSSMDEKERPLIEVYLPKQELANGCAVVLCPGGAMRWLSWESDVVKMVPADAPPLLIMSRVDHPNVAAGLVALFMEWKKAGANAELHLYGDGKGPYELMPQTGGTTTETWSAQMIQWLKAKGFIHS